MCANCRKPYANVEFAVRNLEGEMAQTQRNNAIDKLKNGVVTVLAATDVAARGIDIEDVSHVMNFDLPYSADTYLHRIGRTARPVKVQRCPLWAAHDYNYWEKLNVIRRKF